MRKAVPRKAKYADHCNHQFTIYISILKSFLFWAVKLIKQIKFTTKWNIFLSQENGEPSKDPEHLNHEIKAASMHLTPSLFKTMQV